MQALYKISVAEGLSYEALGDFDAFQKGQQVVIQCERFQELGTVVCRCSQEPIEDIQKFEEQRAKNNKGRHIEGQKLPTILHLASPDECQRANDNLEKANEAHVMTLTRIHAHGLEMKLIQTHYALDRRLLVFQFSADGRVDFRELLRDLSACFHVRVELRQVGVRDEAAILGGIGTCGRQLCCCTFLPSFNSINVKMAKQQGLSLNPQNISGCCGRLRCCLQYEAEYYSQLQEELRNKKQEQQATEQAAPQSPAQSEPPKQKQGGKRKPELLPLTDGPAKGQGKQPKQQRQQPRSQQEQRQQRQGQPQGPKQNQPRPDKGDKPQVIFEQASAAGGDTEDKTSWQRRIGQFDKSSGDKAKGRPPKVLLPLTDKKPLPNGNEKSTGQKAEADCPAPSQD